MTKKNNTKILAENTSIPAVTKAHADKIDSADVSEKKSSEEVYHIVKRGETIFSVARKYHVKPKDLTRWNNFSTSHKLKIGERILIKKSK